MKHSFVFNVLFFLCLTFVSCNNESSNESKMDRRTKIKMKQYIVHGRKLYEKHCSNCHQEDGTGLGKLIPPLKEADYLINNVADVVCIIKHGISEKITVNGITYQQPMPANEGLTPLEIAEIATYVYNSFGNVTKLVGVKEVDQILKDCKIPQNRTFKSKSP